MIKRIAPWVAFAAVAVTLLLAGWSLLFSIFMIYDDEGYVLLSLRNFGLHGALYDQVYSQYGPFFFVAFDALQRLISFEWTNTAGRWITLIQWSLTAAICGAIVWRQFRSVAATTFTIAGVFTYLWVMIHEPIHPGGMVAVLVAAAAWIGTEFDPARHPRSAAAIGAIGAALLLIKINVGGFLLIAATVWLTIHAADQRVRRWGGWLAAGILVLLPWVLMRSLAVQPWVLRFAAIGTCSALGVFLAARSTAQPGAGHRAALAFIAGASAVVIGTAMIVLARGTSLAGLLTGVLLEPLRHPSVYYFAFNWRPASVAVAVASLLLVWIFTSSQRTARLRIITIIRCAAGLAVALSALQLLPIALAPLGLSYGVALAGLCALPLRWDPAGLQNARVRQWVALLLVLQMLHAFPVAGSQLNWGTFLWMPLVVLALRDAWSAWPWCEAGRPRRMAIGAAIVGFGVAAYMGGTLLRTGWQNRHQGEPLLLPGAHDIVVPDETVFGLRIAAANARAHAGTLFSLPGLYSFNLWTNRPTPTLTNATHWFSLLNEGAQDAIIARLKADPRAVVIAQLDTFRYLARHGFAVSGRIADYLATDFEPSFAVDGYAFWIHRGRKIAKLNTGTLESLSDAGRRQLELILPPLPHAISRIEVRSLLSSRNHSQVGILDARNSTVEWVALDETGQLAGDVHPSPWPVDVPATFNRVVVKFSERFAREEDLVAFVFDSTGRELAAARILP